MPKIFRTMQKDGAKPLCGDDSFQLGVRVPPHENSDVTPDDGDFVDPQNGGMSVFARIKKMPARLLPARLRDLYPEDFQKASGDNELTVWCMNSEHFGDEDGGTQLVFGWDVPSKPRHGSIEPAHRMQIDDLQRELCATIKQWEINEAPEQ